MVEISAGLLICGILSTLAGVAYKKWVRASHTSEANYMVLGIARAQHSYQAEIGHYADISGTLDHLYPAERPGPFKTAWGGPCSRCAMPWSTLSVQPDGPVVYGYSTVPSTDVVTTADGRHITFRAPIRMSPGALAPPTEPYFVVQAIADTNGDGITSTSLFFSQTGDIVVENEGE
jgi:hypothetical protein